MWNLSLHCLTLFLRSYPLVTLRISGVVTEEVKTTFKGIKNGLYPVYKVGKRSCTALVNRAVGGLSYPGEQIR